MQLAITIAENESDLTALKDDLRGLGAEQLALSKSDKTTLSIYDTLSMLVQNPEAAAAIGAGIGALLASLGNRAKVTVRKDGTVIADRVSSKDAAAIVASAVHKDAKPA